MATYSATDTTLGVDYEVMPTGVFRHTDGSWGFRADASGGRKKRKQLKRVGFSSMAAARNARSAFVAGKLGTGRIETITVSEWFDEGNRPGALSSLGWPLHDLSSRRNRPLPIDNHFARVQIELGPSKAANFSASHTSRNPCGPHRCVALCADETCEGLKLLKVPCSTTSSGKTRRGHHVVCCTARRPSQWSRRQPRCCGNGGCVSRPNVFRWVLGGPDKISFSLPAKESRTRRLHSMTDFIIWQTKRDCRACRHMNYGTRSRLGRSSLRCP